MLRGVGLSAGEESATCDKRGVVRFLMGARGAGAAGAVRETRSGERGGRNVVKWYPAGEPAVPWPSRSA